MTKKGQTDSEKQAKRGIKDPWRAHLDDPDPGASVMGTPASDHPLDEDLKPTRRFMFRMPETDNTILVYNASSNDEAVLRLVEAVRDCPEIRTVLQDVGFVCCHDEGYIPQGFIMKAAGYVVCLPTATSSEEGFRRFINTLLWHNREAKFKKFLSKHGLAPLLV